VLRCDGLPSGDGGTYHRLTFGFPSEPGGASRLPSAPAGVSPPDSGCAARSVIEQSLADLVDPRNAEVRPLAGLPNDLEHNRATGRRAKRPRRRRDGCRRGAVADDVDDASAIWRAPRHSWCASSARCSDTSPAPSGCLRSRKAVSPRTEPCLGAAPATLDATGRDRDAEQGASVARRAVVFRRWLTHRRLVGRRSPYGLSERVFAKRACRLWRARTSRSRALRRRGRRRRSGRAGRSG
jgi:hypothetical protein